MTPKPQSPLVGEIRPSQLLHSFGVGAVIDLPHISALVMGLEDWAVGYCAPIEEQRLLRAVREQMGEQVERLVSPPRLPESDGSLGPAFGDAATVGVPVAPFPRFLRCPSCNLLAPLRSGLFKLKTNPYRPDRARYVHANCNKAQEPAVLPARFLLACEDGHLDDFPWYRYVHKGSKPCTGQLYLEESGISGEATDVWVRCGTCGDRRPMSDAFGEEAPKHLPACSGRRPQLRDYQETVCKTAPRTILLGASNSWFAVSLSVLYVPPAPTDRLAGLVEHHWALLAPVEDAAVIKYLRSKGELGAFDDVKNDVLWAAIEAHRAAPAGQPDKDLKTPEWKAFSTVDTARNNTDFHVEDAPVPERFRPWLSRVVLAGRLREVNALLGFTRIGSPRDFSGLTELPSHVRAPLSRKPPTFLPASEVRGEGVFLVFDEANLAEWCKRQDDLETTYLTAHTAWRRRRQIDPPEGGFPGLRFLLLHSFSHALMRQLSLECGYSAASLRERIYASDGDDDRPAMAGVLLYTAVPDSEGTLGGLVRMGQPKELERHIARALDSLRLCSSDPLCSDHEPESDGSTLHGGACHACLFAPETSCERGNRYLDRSVLVPTVKGLGHAFFGEAGR